MAYQLNAPRGYLAEWFSRVGFVPGANVPPYLYRDLFAVVSNSTRRPRHVILISLLYICLFICLFIYKIPISTADIINDSN